MKLLSKLNNRKTIYILIILAAFIAVSTFAVWWQYSYNTADKVFRRMIENSLSTYSVTKTSSVQGEFQSVEQKTVARIEAPQALYTKSNIRQGGGEQSSSVSRETLVTLDQTLIKLTDISTGQTTADGEAFDFSSILDTWGTSPATANDNSLAQLYSQNVAVPFASLEYKDRQEVLNLIDTQTVYEVDFSKARMVKQDGRDMYIYEVGVKPSGFISMMKLIGQKVGLDGYDEVDPTAYEQLPVVPFTFVVDVISGNLVSVDYGDGQIEHYSAYGMRFIPMVPEETITMTELQQRLQSLQ